ncbi:hypothetical protein OG417_52915 [Actinoallomurus sp. NBC_01490]|uniref:hypothetical protein n=1 Tax=Actinoallomurus sp. NBC_01490 TaxID=2903557 RepID=UPI002E309D61|nr:hypothetical protein [Actinoallomurus sp. NBC_01490]
MHRDMSHHRAPGPFIRMARGALVATAIVAPVALTPATGASAALTPTRGGGGAGSADRNHTIISRSGNGKFNKNIFAVNDPSIIRGHQNVSNQNIGGQTATQNAICKWKRTHCKINQRMLVRDP